MVPQTPGNARAFHHQNAIITNDCDLRLRSSGSVDSGFRDIHRGTRIPFH
jgi:hypothetical protein